LRAADGRTRGWSRTHIERPVLAQHYPFIIQHDNTGEERRFRLAGWSTPPEHPLGATKVLSATIAVADLGEAAQRFQHIYGLQPSEPPFPGEADGWDAMLVSFALGQSGQHFELAVPLPLSVDQDIDIEHLPGPGALARHLQQLGESLCRVTLAVESLAASRRYLDEHEVTYSCQDHNQIAHLAWVLNLHLRPLTNELGGRLDYDQPGHRSRLPAKTFGGVMVLCSTEHATAFT